jgi:benzoyl-CoA reductase/2-hydroxyglutaryl-CoA dehydratase subunit BcrC/BadD/HgdB
MDKGLPDNAIGLTSTIPVEVVYAAGYVPVDLNNLFITSERPDRLIASAEAVGFSHTICAWIKGIYSVVMQNGLKRIIAVTGGDCSNTVALADLLRDRGVDVLTFDFPLNRDRKALQEEVERLIGTLSTTWKDVDRVRQRLGAIRRRLEELDRFTHKENVVTGFENHHFLVTSSDFQSDPDAYERALDRFLSLAGEREPFREEIRLGYLGVPPIFSGFYELVESFDGRVVFNEVQRQFSLPYQDRDLVDLYLKYTYPYTIDARLPDIRKAIKERRLDGLIHYTQTNCHRQIYDILLRERLPIPILTLEGDRPGNPDGRTAFRIETFLEMLKDRKEREG